MHPNPSLALIVSSVLGILVAFALMMVGALWARVRSLPVEETTRMVDDLARRQDTIEGLLIKFERDRDDRLSASLSTVSFPRDGTDHRFETVQRIDRAKTTAVGGPTLIVVPSLATTLPGASATAAAELSRRFGAIWAQADSGLSPESIARATGQPIGQVELILGLRVLTGQPAEPS